MAQIPNISAERASAFVSNPSPLASQPQPVQSSLTSYNQAATQSSSPSLSSQFVDICQKIIDFVLDLFQTIFSCCSGTATRAAPTQTHPIPTHLLEDDLFEMLIDEAAIWAREVQEVKATSGQHPKPKFDCIFYMYGQSRRGETISLGAEAEYGKRHFPADTAQKACDDLLSSLRKDARFLEMLQNSQVCIGGIEFKYAGYANYKYIKFELNIQNGQLTKSIEDNRTHPEFLRYHAMLNKKS